MKNLPFKGRVRIFGNSSLRKLARALRRGLVPPERMRIIDQAMKSAAHTKGQDR